MNIVYSDQPIYVGGGSYGSIFLAGPTPRDHGVESWRPSALKILQDAEFEGTVLVPEHSDASIPYDYIDQVEWEYSGLCKATSIVFWVPRNIATMPAFTTNVEFGYWLGKGSESRVFYGRPDGAPKNRYLDWLYQKTTSQTPSTSLENVLADAMGFVVSRNRSRL